MTNENERVWTAEEILGEIPRGRPDDIDIPHDEMWRELAAFLAKCTRLMMALEDHRCPDHDDLVEVPGQHWHSAAHGAGYVAALKYLEAAMNTESEPR